MKNLVLASALGALTSALIVPAVGPVHYALTRPYSMFLDLLVANGQAATLGVVPLDFVMTDITLSLPTALSRVTIKVNGNPVFCVPGETIPPTSISGPDFRVKGGTHLTTGIFIPAGSTVSAEASSTASWGNPSTAITIAGYVQ